MLYIDKLYWNAALLTMSISDYKDLEEIIENNQIENIVFEFTSENLTNIKVFKSNEIVEFVKLISLEKYQTKIKSKNVIRTTKISFQELQFLSNYTHIEFFKILSVAIFSKKNTWNLIENIKIEFKNGTFIECLSEGQKKQILIKCATQIIADENSILLLDEPDSHIHISNQSKIKDSLFDNITNKPHVQTILTTHSPILSNCFDNNNIYMLSKKDDIVSIEDIDKQKAFNHLSDGILNIHEQNLLLGSNKPVILLVEGKHDKEHITNAYEKLKDEYKDLDFDIFDMGGEGNIRPVLSCLYENSEKNNQKIYIGIYDNDDAGRKSSCINKDNKKSTTDTIELYINNNKISNCHLMLLPKVCTDIKQDCTIENLLPYKKYKEAYKKAYENQDFQDKSIDAINNNIKDGAKKILSENSKTFEKEDFANFRQLFDLILKIKNISQQNINNNDNLKITTDNPVDNKQEKQEINDNVIL